MNTPRIPGLFLAILISLAATADRLGAADLFIVDQRADLSGAVFFSVRTNSPLGQSFIPATNAVGYVELNLQDANPTNATGATLHVNLRPFEATTNQDGLPDHISGPVIASSHRTAITNAHFGPTRFVFAANIPVIPGTPYWIELVGDSGDDCRAVVYHFTYPRGDAFVNGTNFGGTFSIWDMWFREGVVAQFPRLDWTDRLPPQDISPETLFGRVTGWPGYPIIFQESHDLESWVSLGTNQNSLFIFQVRVQTGQRRFYRALYDQ